MPRYIETGSDIYNSFFGYNTHMEVEDITQHVLDVCDTIITMELPPFPGLREHPETTLINALEELESEHTADLVNFYCSTHGLKSPFLCGPPESQIPTNQLSLL